MCVRHTLRVTVTSSDFSAEPSFFCSASSWKCSCGGGAVGTSDSLEGDDESTTGGAATGGAVLVGVTAFVTGEAATDAAFASTSAPAVGDPRASASSPPPGAGAAEMDSAEPASPRGDATPSLSGLSGGPEAAAAVPEAEYNS
nr:uncharacterized protein LOC113822025 [Penaeus vannamei]